MVGYITSFTAQLAFGENVERVPAPDPGFAVEITRLVTPLTVLAGVGQAARTRNWYVGLVTEAASPGLQRRGLTR